MKLAVQGVELSLGEGPGVERGDRRREIPGSLHQADVDHALDSTMLAPKRRQSRSRGSSRVNILVCPSA